MALAEKHGARALDPELGWVRRPLETGVDQTQDGVATYAIDALGRRRNPGFEDAPSKVAVFGDSFAFCRLVPDDATWPHFLSTLRGDNVENWGVGNYGLDQALLRLESKMADLTADVIVMAVVPETIARVRSYWKHFFEYGNVLAFKPMFTLEHGDLRLHPPAVRTTEDYGTYRRRLGNLARMDYFHDRKFVRDILTFPYLPRLLARARRHLPILAHLAAGRLTGRRDAAFRKAFGEILVENARWTARLYRDRSSTELLRALVRRFADKCRKSGKTPLLVIIPQPADLARPDRGRAHEGFLASLEEICPVLDFTPMFRDASSNKRLFVEGPLGPHPSSTGNRLIASVLGEKLKTITANAHA